MIRGEIYYADLSPVQGSEQGGNRPVLIIQNDVGNKYSPTIICAAITTQHKTHVPTHVHLSYPGYGLTNRSMVLLEQIRTIDKCRIANYVGQLDSIEMSKVNKALQISLGLEV